MKILPDTASVHTHNGVFGAISVTERNCAADSFCAIRWCSMNDYSDRPGSE